MNAPDPNVPAALHPRAGESPRATSDKSCFNFGLPWEREFGYAQVVRAGDLLFVSGQLSHDEAGQLVSPAPVDAHGRVTDTSHMQEQVRQSYRNLGRILAHFGLSPDDVVEEVLYVLDMDAAFAASPPVRREFYGRQQPVVACTMVTTARLAFPEQLVEIKFVVQASQGGAMLARQGDPARP